MGVPMNQNDGRRPAAGQPALHIGVDTSGESTIVMPVGVLSTSTAPELRDTLLKCIADQPVAVIVDLALLQVQAGYTLSIFGVVARRTADWSGVPLLLVSRPPNDDLVALRTTALARFVRVYPTLEVALTSTTKPPIRRLVRLDLPPDTESARTARRFVARTCERWGCESLTDDATAIASELVGNAIRHGDGELSLRLELRRQLLTVAVADESPVPPRLTPVDADGQREGGHGMVIVAALARTWGSTPTTTGGKVVWSVLRLDER